MPAAVAIKSRQNRIKLFKKFLRHGTPHFRCYHGSRLPPRSFEGMWPHSKFFAKDIKRGAPVRQKKAPKLLEKKLKAEPKKRKKRGILKKTVTGKKKKAQIKSLKPKKYVQFGKKALHKRREQEAKEYAGTTRYGQAARTYGSKGDVQRRVFTKDPATGLLVPQAAPARKIMYV